MNSRLLIISLYLVWIFAALPASHAHAFNFTDAGDVAQFVPSATAILVTAVNGDKEGFKQFAKATAVGAAMTYSLKVALNVERPNGGKYSFPSGHSWIAFNGAEFLRKRYGWKYGVPAYIVAGFVGWSRVEAKAHRWEDVLAGGVIAYGANYFFTEKRVTIVPVVDGNIVGVKLNTSW